MDKLLEELLKQSPIAVTLGVGLYTLYKAYQDQIKYNREQDKLTSEILSKLVPVVDGLKEGTVRTGTNLDRNLSEFSAGNERINDKLMQMTSAIERLEISMNAFLEHIRGREK